MIDYYATRKDTKSRFIERIDPVFYSGGSEIITNDEIEFYKKNGYLILSDFFERIEIVEANEKANFIFQNPENFYTNKEMDKKTVRSVLNIEKIEEFEILLNRLTILIKEALADDIYIHQSRINYKAGLGTGGWNWHSDFETWHSQDGMPRMRCLTAMIPLVNNLSLIHI